MKGHRVATVVLCSSVLACSASLRHLPGATREPLAWSDLRGWVEDDHAAAYSAFLASCSAVVEAGLKTVCATARARGLLDEENARRFFEESFTPVRISAAGEDDGLVTGYYVPVFAGSMVASNEFPTPLYGKPRRAADLSYTREEIENGALARQGLELLWVDPIDAFFAQIQGSARVRLPDGRLTKLEYAAKNEHPYTAVGRILIERGLVSRDEMSMQRIRAWMTANPDEAAALRRCNKAFVFFTTSPAGGDEEGVGAQGMRLVPERSIAVDNKLHAYGTPFFIMTALPIENEQVVTPFHHLMVAMDTGSAIVGPARADIYWGVGERAAEVAGRIKHRAVFVILEAKSAATP